MECICLYWKKIFGILTFVICSRTLITVISEWYSIHVIYSIIALLIKNVPFKLAFTHTCPPPSLSFSLYIYIYNARGWISFWYYDEKQLFKKISSPLLSSCFSSAYRLTTLSRDYGHSLTLCPLASAVDRSMETIGIYAGLRVLEKRRRRHIRRITKAPSVPFANRT